MKPNNARIPRAIQRPSRWRGRSQRRLLSGRSAAAAAVAAAGSAPYSSSARRKRTAMSMGSTARATTSDASSE